MGGERRGEVLGRVGFLHVILSFFPLASSVFVIFLSRLGYAIHETVSLQNLLRNLSRRPHQPAPFAAATCEHFEDRVLSPLKDDTVSR
jgi:hypothetical protein